MGKSSLPRARTRGRHRRVEPKTWQHATPPRVIGYAVAVFLTVIAVSSAYHRTDSTQAAPEPAPQAAAAAQPAAQFLVPQVTPTIPDLSAPTPEPRLVASETPEPAPITTDAAPTTTKRPALAKAPETTKAPKPTSRTSSAEPSQPTQSAEPSQTTQPSEQPSESAPPSQPEPQPTPPSSSEPTRPGLLPELGGVIDGLTGPLLNR